MQCAGDTAPFGKPGPSSRGAARPAAPILNISSFQRREAAAAGVEDTAAVASRDGEAAVASGVQSAGAAYPVEAGLVMAGAGTMPSGVVLIDKCAAFCEIAVPFGFWQRVAPPTPAASLLAQARLGVSGLLAQPL